MTPQSFQNDAIEAVGFDLGETLLFYNGTPLNWASVYEPALAAVAADCGLEPSPAEIAAGCGILRQHNSRLVPREVEISSDRIFAALLAAWQAPESAELLTSATASFFGFFQRRMCLYPDTMTVLRALRGCGLPTGILSDVPYGMPASFVRQDLCAAGIDDLINVVLTSAEVGWRKPATAGFVGLAERLGTVPEKLLFVGNEAKDVLGASRAGARAVFLDHGASGINHGQQATIHCIKDVLTLIAQSSHYALQSPDL